MTRHRLRLVRAAARSRQGQAALLISLPSSWKPHAPIGHAPDTRIPGRPRAWSDPLRCSRWMQQIESDGWLDELRLDESKVHFRLSLKKPRKTTQLIVQFWDAAGTQLGHPLLRDLPALRLHRVVRSAPLRRVHRASPPTHLDQSSPLLLQPRDRRGREVVRAALRPRPPRRTAGRAQIDVCG